MKILISPYSAVLPNGNKNPKDYPYWKQLANLLFGLGHELYQIGTKDESTICSVIDKHYKDLKMRDIKKLLDECDVWISVDNFFQHMAWYYDKPGFVLFGQSDPELFGHPENYNIYKDRKYFRPMQYDVWFNVQLRDDAFVDPGAVVSKIEEWQKKRML
jgi:ADP-heptose:LPS heptosyltransferase